MKSCYFLLYKWVILGILIVSELGLSQSVYSQSTQGIQFFRGSWAEALAEAKTQRKLLFVDAYAIWSGPSKMMDRNTFPQAAVGEFYNKHFINYKINIERGEGLDLAQKYTIRKPPTWLFINYDGRQVFRDSLYKAPEDFIQMGQQAIDPNRNQSLLALEFESGSRDPGKLFAYALLLKSSGADFQPVSRRYFSTQAEKDLFKKRQNWKAIQAFTVDLNSREFQYLLKKAKKFKNKYGVSTVEKKISEVCQNATLKAGLTGNRTLHEQSKGIAQKYIKDDGKRAQRLEMTYAATRRDWESYGVEAQTYFDQYKGHSADEWNRAAQYLQKYESDPQRLQTALEWSRQAVSQDRRHDTQFVYAALLYKLKYLDDALPAANQALSQAKQLGDARLRAKWVRSAERLVRDIQSARASNK